ncbi:MAG: aminotransferase class V-fold PLP-dependent enzyme [Thermoanaerobaculia bacterium]|nr:aminotransferase class V-fold PLP-dependent enzyme [Thermoanaerobaculia bacterium]
MRDYRSDFHHFEGATYLNCAFHGAMPRVATRAVEEALELKKRPHRIRDADHFDYPDAFRAAAADLIGAEPEDVAVTDSATHGVMILVAGLDWRDGDEVVLPAGEFPANLFPWRSLTERGVVVREVPLPTDEDPVERLAAVLTERTRVVATSWVGYSTGRRLDLARLGSLCHDAGALLAVDGSQGIGGIPFSLEELPCDLVTCAGYKWMLGPYGVGFAWVRPGLAERLRPANINWFSLEGARDFDRLSECELAFVPGARRFDINEPGNFLNMAGAAAATRYVGEIGPSDVRDHVLELFDVLLDGLPHAVRSLAPSDERQRSNILCLGLPSEETGRELLEALRRERVFVSLREGALRISPHLYNAPDDIERLLAVLDANIQRAAT